MSMSAIIGIVVLGFSVRKAGRGMFDSYPVPFPEHTLPEDRPPCYDTIRSQVDIPDPVRSPQSPTEAFLFIVPILPPSAP